MIIAAGLLVLGGLGLFVAGVLTGVATFYWACVGACVVAAVLLLLARRRMSAPASALAPASAPASAPAVTAPPAARLAATSAAAAPAAVRTPSEPDGPSTGRHAVAGSAEAGEPPVEEVEVADLLLVVDLTDEVLVVDEHPRYHVARCRHLADRDTIPLPVDEAKSDGFTPCGTCRPDATLADRVRAKRTASEN